MNILTLESAPTGRAPSLSEDCLVVVLYEDFETARHTSEVHTFICDKLQVSPEAPLSQWKLNLLENPKLRELAAKEIRMAEVVVVSTHGDRDLPEEAKDFLASALAQRPRGTGGLVVLFDRFDNYYARTAISHFMEQAAQANGMEFLGESPDWGRV